MPIVSQLTVWVEDRPGALGEVASVLGEKRVNILGYMAAVIEGRGVVRLVVDKPTQAKKVLARAGWQISEEKLAGVTLVDKPGSLGSAASKLGAAGINIQYAYAGSAKGARKVEDYFAVTDPKAALKVLRRVRG